MASPASPIAQHETQPSLSDLSNELLESIFLHLPTPVDLARTSTACPSFRRIVTKRSFLHRYRKRHPPPLLGFADRGGFRAAQAPHPSARLACALADAADFTYSFVPNPNKHPWCPRDVRDGRVLLDTYGTYRWETLKTVLAMCDPLSRPYVLLPPVPGDLAEQGETLDEAANVLAPIHEDEAEKPFKVICMARYETKVVVFVFSSVTQQWSIAASSSWGSLGTDRPWGFHDSCSAIGCRGLSCFHYVRGCFYSASPWMDKLLVLDTRTMEFSTVNNLTGYHNELRDLPGQAQDALTGSQEFRHRPGQVRSLPGIVVGKEESVDVFSLVGHHSPNASFHLYHTSQQNSGESEWELDNIVPLPGQYDYFTVGAAEGFLFLGGTTEDQGDIDPYSGVWLPRTDWDVDYFALEVQTSELTKICRSRKPFFHFESVNPYFGFPPSLSKPSI